MQLGTYSSLPPNVYVNHGSCIVVDQAGDTEQTELNTVSLGKQAPWSTSDIILERRAEDAGLW